MKRKPKKRRSYQGAEVEADCGKVAGQHSEKIKPMAKSIDVATHSLLAIPISYFRLKHRNLVQSDIPSFTNLNVFMMGDISPAQRRIVTYAKQNKYAIKQSDMY